MFKTNIQLSTIDHVKTFVSAISDFDFSVDLVSGKYCVNGKSIMGIFSLDLAKPIGLQAEIPHDLVDSFTEAIAAFVVS